MRLHLSTGSATATLLALLPSCTALPPGDELERDVVFLSDKVLFESTSGEDLMLEPDAYVVGSTDGESLQLTGAETGTFQLKAAADTHAEALERPEALSVEEDDTYRVCFLLPGGKRLEALGFVGGVRTRGTTPRVLPAARISQARRAPTRRPASTTRPTRTTAMPGSLEERVAALERMLAQTRAQLAALRSSGAGASAADAAYVQALREVLTVAANGNVSLRAKRKLTLRADRDLSVRGGTGVDVESGTHLKAKGATTTLEGGSMLSLRAAITKINNGGKPVAHVGSATAGAPGAPLVRSGSPTVLVP